MRRWPAVWAPGVDQFHVAVFGPLGRQGHHFFDQVADLEILDARIGFAGKTEQFVGDRFAALALGADLFRARSNSDIRLLFLYAPSSIRSWSQPASSTMMATGLLISWAIPAASSPTEASLPVSITCWFMISFSLSDVAMRRTIFVDIQTAMVTMATRPETKREMAMAWALRRSEKASLLACLYTSSQSPPLSRADT
jgi:hypothetical protein